MKTTQPPTTITGRDQHLITATDLLLIALPKASVQHHAMDRPTAHRMGQKQTHMRVVHDGCPPPQEPPPLQLRMTCTERRICGKDPLRRMEIRSLRAEVEPIAQQEPQSTQQKKHFFQYWQTHRKMF